MFELNYKTKLLLLEAIELWISHQNQKLASTSHETQASKLKQEMAFMDAVREELQNLKDQVFLM